MSGWDRELHQQHYRVTTHLTNGNCQRSVPDLVNDYVGWAREQRLQVVHVFPERKSPAAAANITHNCLRRLNGVELVEVDPEDYS